ncbi:MAG: 16S rRNA (cytidine(1402)-2'-O)-methyltransferase [Polyangiaceae bacterium]
MATLYIVATPIGNLDDLSPRVARTLAEVDEVLAEDTRRARQLLSHLGLAKKVHRLDAEVERRDTPRWLERLAAGQSLAVVSDAGAPGVSDPGAALVRAALAAGITVTPIAGPSAVTTALMASGFSAERFRFFGFLPRAGARRKEVLGEIRDTPEAVVFFEAPGRLQATLTQLAGMAPERPVVVARELTKLHEELLVGSTAEVAATAEGRRFQGEITVVLGPRGEVAVERLTPEALDARIQTLLAEGMRAKDVAKTLALDSGWGVREVYDRIHQRP